MKPSCWRVDQSGYTLSVFNECEWNLRVAPGAPCKTRMHLCVTRDPPLAFALSAASRMPRINIFQTSPKRPLQSGKERVAVWPIPSPTETAVCQGVNGPVGYARPPLQAISVQAVPWPFVAAVASRRTKCASGHS